MCTRKDMLARYLGTLSLDGVMSVMSVMSDGFQIPTIFYFGRVLINASINLSLINLM